MRFQLACSRCGRCVPFTLQTGLCACGGTMLVEYDLDRIGRVMTKQDLPSRAPSMWRYAELLPVERKESIVSLGEGWTPLVRLERAEREHSIRRLWVKREEQNPTGSFKSRGFSAAVSIAREYGVQKVAVNSNGNAASALAAYAAYAGMQAYVFLPLDCPGLIVEECKQYGAHTSLVDGLIHDAGAIVAEGAKEQGWHHVGTLKEPGRAEGKKTMGLELAEQLQWRLPDVIVYPTGGGSGIIGMWNAFKQLRQLGWIDGSLPRMVSVQEAGCQPLVDAIASGGAFEPQREGGVSQPTGMRVPNPPDGELLARIIRQSGGTAVAVTADEIAAGVQAMGGYGISSSPEGAAAWAGFRRLSDSGWIRPEDEVVLFNTSHALKYVPWMCEGVPTVRTYKEWLQAQVRPSDEMWRNSDRNVKNV